MISILVHGSRADFGEHVTGHRLSNLLNLLTEIAVISSTSPSLGIVVFREAVSHKALPVALSLYCLSQLAWLCDSPNQYTSQAGH